MQDGILHKELAKKLCKVPKEQKFCPAHPAPGSQKATPRGVALDLPDNEKIFLFGNILGGEATSFQFLANSRRGKLHFTCRELDG